MPPQPLTTSAETGGGNSERTLSGRSAPWRTYLIVVDTLHSAFANFLRVRQALDKFFEREEPGDAQYALVALGRAIKVVQDSTSDPRAIIAAIQSNEFSKRIRDFEAANVAVAVEQFEPLVDGYCAVCQCGARQPANCGDGVYKPQVQGFLNIFSERTLSLDRQFLGKLKSLVEAAAGMPTSRTIVFISDGFNRFSGRELYAVLQGHGVREGIFTFNPRDNQPGLDVVLKLATKYDVKFYTLDSRGLYTEASLAGNGFSASSSGSSFAVDSMIRSAARENTDALAELAQRPEGSFTKTATIS